MDRMWVRAGFVASVVAGLFAGPVGVAPLAGQFGPAPTVARQIGPTGTGGGFRAGVAVTLDSYTFDDPQSVSIETLRLLSIPVAARVGLARGWELQVTSAWAQGDLTRGNGTTATVQGPTDTEIHLIRGLGERFTFGAIAVLPTGASTFTEDEADVAAMVAADVLPFRLTSWGAGGAVGATTGVSGLLGGGIGGGIAVTVVRSSDFQPYVEDFSYRPGSQFQIRGVLDRTFGTSSKAALNVSLQTFSEDQGDGSNFFQPGTRVQAVGSYSFAVGPRSSGIVYGGYHRRWEGSYVMDEGIIPLQEMLLAGGGLRIPVRRSVVQPSVELRRAAGDDLSGTGYTATGGVAVELPVGGMILVPSLRGRFGDVTLWNGRTSGFTGFELGFGTRFGGIAR